MALFKILRGGVNALEQQEIHDGWAYFTPADASLYIDVKDTIDGVSYNKRIKVAGGDSGTVLQQTEIFPHGATVCTYSLPEGYNIADEMIVYLSVYNDTSTNVTTQFLARKEFLKMDFNVTVNESERTITLTAKNGQSAGANIPLQIIYKKYVDEGSVTVNGGSISHMTPTYETYTLLASGWSVDGRYRALETQYPASSGFDLEVSADGETITEDEITVFSKAQICGSALSNVLIAKGDIPSIDLPVIVRKMQY